MNSINIPPDLLERLALLGEKPELFSDIYKARGADFFVSFLRVYIEQREEASSLYREWSPKLRAYANQCRSSNACPDSQALSEQDRAKLPIYESKIMKAERLRPKDGHCVIICSIPFVGVSVAQRLWPGEDSLSIILTPLELRQWWETYKHPEEAFWWWIDYWWKIEDRPNTKRSRFRKQDLQVPDGESPWLVTSGLRWGPLAGGATTELWSWNGREAKFVRDIGKLIF